MAQKPVLTAETIAAARPRVVREVFGNTVVYSDLSSSQQSSVDATMNDAFMDVTNRAKWYAEIDPSTNDLPTEFNELFSAMAVAKLKREFRSPQEFHAHWTAYVDPLFERIERQYASAWLSNNPLASDEVNIRSLRRSVLSVLVRQRTPVFIQPTDVDLVCREEFVRLWHCRWWQFRKRGPQKVTIKEDGSIVSANADIVSALASRYFVVQGAVDAATANRIHSTVVWLDATRAAEQASRLEGVTGRPRYFYDTLVAGVRSVLVLPTPDQDYTAWVVFYIDAPQFTTGGSGTGDGLRQLPIPMRSHLRDRVVAKLLSDAGMEDTDASRKIASVARDFELLAQQYDDGGPSQQAVPFVARGWTEGLSSFRGGNILQQLG